MNVCTNHPTLLPHIGAIGWKDQHYQDSNPQPIFPRTNAITNYTNEESPQYWMREFLLRLHTRHINFFSIIRVSLLTPHSVSKHNASAMLLHTVCWWPCILLAVAYSLNWCVTHLWFANTTLSVPACRIRIWFSSRLRNVLLYIGIVKCMLLARLVCNTWAWHWTLDMYPESHALSSRRALSWQAVISLQPECECKGKIDSCYNTSVGAGWSTCASACSTV